MNVCFTDYAAVVTSGMEHPPKNYMLALEYTLIVEDAYRLQLH